MCFRIGIWSLSLIEAVSGAWGGFGGGVRKVRGVAQYEEGKVRPPCPSCYPPSPPKPTNSSSLEEKTFYAELEAFKSLEVFRLGKIHFHLIKILLIRCPPKCQSTCPTTSPGLVITKPEDSQSKNNLFTEQETFMRKLWQLVSELSSCKLCFILPFPHRS